MTTLNLVRTRGHRLSRREWGLCGVMVLSATAGGLGAAGMSIRAQEERAQEQTQAQATQAHLHLLQRQIDQMQATDLQHQKVIVQLRHVQALRQQGQNLRALLQTLGADWPAGLQIQEMRLEGPLWRLQGLAPSAGVVGQALQGLTQTVAWQQPPTLQALEVLPPVPGQTLNLRYLVQAQWFVPEVPAKPAVSRPTASLGAVSERQ